MKTDSGELDRDIENARRRNAVAQLAMAEKLATVEKQIRETVAGAQSAINNVKGEIGSLRSAAIGAIITALWKIAKQSLSAPGGQHDSHEVSPPRQTGKPV